MSHQHFEPANSYPLFNSFEQLSALMLVLDRIARVLEQRSYKDPRRGLNREQAALYIGVSVTSFDKMVAIGRMPGPVRFGKRRVWDLHQLDNAFHGGPTIEHSNSWDD